MDTGLTTIAEADIAKHRATAQSMITRVIVLEDSSGQSNTALAGTGRRFVSTVSTGGRAGRARWNFTRPSRRSARRSADGAPASTRCSTGRGADCRWRLPSPMSSRAARPRKPAVAQRARAAGRRGCQPFQGAPVGIGLCFGLHFAAYLSQLIDSEGEPPKTSPSPTSCSIRPQDALKCWSRRSTGQLRGATDDAALTEPRATPSPASPSMG